MYVKQKNGVVVNNDDALYRALVAQRDTSKHVSLLQNQIHNLEQHLIEIRSELSNINRSN